MASRIVIGLASLAVLISSIIGLITFKEVYANAPMSYQFDKVVYITGLIVAPIILLVDIFWDKVKNFVESIDD